MFSDGSGIAYIAQSVDLQVKSSPQTDCVLVYDNKCKCDSAQFILCLFSGAVLLTSVLSDII